MFVGSRHTPALNVETKIEIKCAACDDSAHRVLLDGGAVALQNAFEDNGVLRRSAPAEMQPGSLERHTQCPTAPGSHPFPPWVVGETKSRQSGRGAPAHWGERAHMSGIIASC